ncbi:MAG TPA: tetratricopeptide repeat protein, partial [Thermoplasmata archaeon]|nr:tetratricopeptide repeat protein [Thermoplasmata archaeon]
GRLPDAVDALREALRIDSTKAGDIILKAEQLRRDGHPNEAVILFQAVLDLVPTETRAVLGLGDSLLDLGDMDGAESLFARALGTNPENPPILFRRGELLERKGRWGAAIQYYNRAIALRWNFADPWFAKGRVLLEHDRPKEALECFDKVVSFEPSRVEGWASKARAHAILGDRDAAEIALGRSSAIAPDDSATRAAREALGAPAPSEPEAAPRAESPSDFPALMKAFEEIEEEPEPAPPSTPAAPDFQSFVESIEPDDEDPHVLLQLADLALEGGDPQMALLRYEQAIEREPRNPDGWTGKGISLQQLERYDDALAAYDKALAIKPDHETARKWRTTCVRHLDPEAGG